MKTLVLTDEEAAVLWFIGRELSGMVDRITKRPNGKQAVASLSAKLMALAAQYDEPEAQKEQP